VNPRSIRLHQYAGFIALALAACSGGRAVNHNMTNMPSAHGSTAASAAAIDAILAPYNSLNVPGASVVVLRGGEVVYERAFGSADLEAHTAATVRTDYRLASLTKAFTAMSIMLLVKDGKLHYDDRVIDVLPGFPEYARDIRIRHLLTHTSGIVDYRGLRSRFADDAAERRRRARARAPHGHAELRARLRVSLQQLRVRAARPHRAPNAGSRRSGARRKRTLPES